MDFRCEWGLCSASQREAPLKSILLVVTSALWALSAAGADPWAESIQTAERFQMERSFADAERVLREAVARAPMYPDREYRLAYAFNNLGLVAHDQGRYLDAERHYRTSLAHWERAGSRARTAQAVTFNNLASLLFDAGRLREAGNLQRRALGLAGDDPLILINAGDLFFRVRMLTEAEDAYGRAYSLLEPAQRSRGLQFARVCQRLGQLYQRTGREKQAARHFAPAQAIWEKHLAATAAATEIVVDLALLYTATGQHGRAKALLDRGLAIAENELGPAHPQFGAFLSFYAQVLRRTGDKAEAARRDQQASAIAAGSEQSLIRGTISATDFVTRKENTK